MSSSSSTKGKANLKSLRSGPVNSMPVLGGKYKAAKLLLKQEQAARRKAKGKGPARKKQRIDWTGLSSIAPIAADVGEMINKYAGTKNWSWTDLVSDLVGKAGKHADNFSKMFTKFFPVGVGSTQSFRTISLAGTKGWQTKTVKLGVDQVGIASPFVINSFGSPVMSQSPGGVFNIIHGDFLQSLTIPASTVAGDEVFSLDLTPTMGTWLAKMANFEKYRIKKVGITYNPMCPTTTAGALAGVFESDIDNLIPAGSGESTMKTVMSHQTASIVDIWTPHSWVFVPESPDWCYVAPGGHEPRLEKQGQFRIFAAADFPSELKAAALTLTYHIEFITAELQNLATGSYDERSLVATTASSVDSISGPTNTGTDYALSLQDTDYEVGGSYASIARTSFIHLQSSETTAAAMKDSTAPVISKEILKSPGVGKATRSILISVPAGYWYVDIGYWSSSSCSPSLECYGGYGTSKDSSIQSTGAIIEVDSTGTERARTHAAYGTYSGHVGVFVRSNGYCTLDDQSYIDWTRTLKGLCFRCSAIMDGAYVIAVPVSNSKAWTTTDSLMLNMNKMQKRMAKVEEELEIPTPLTTKMLEPCKPPCTCEIHKKL